MKDFISKSLGRALTAKEQQACQIVHKLLEEVRVRIISEKFDRENELKKLMQKIEIMNIDETTFRYLESFETLEH